MRKKTVAHSYDRGVTAGLQMAKRIAQAEWRMLKKANSDWNWDYALGVLITKLQKRIESS